MKKILFAIAIITMVLCAKAQTTDGFFSSYDGGYDNRGSSSMDTPSMVTPSKPIGLGQNESAPLGSGLLIMTALGAGYVMTKKRK